MSEPAAYFISDVHLHKDAPAIRRAFIDFCHFWKPQKIRLFILGDLFDAWLGDEQIPEWQDIVDALKEMSDNGSELFLQHGNRDFLIGDEFAKQTGCRIIEDEYLVTLHGKKVFLDHGEIFCSNDPGSLRARTKRNSREFKETILQLPVKEREQLRDRLFSESKEHKHRQQQIKGSMQASDDRIRDYLKKTNCDILIYGHTHEERHTQIDVSNGKSAQVLNAGCWRPEGKNCYITLDQKGVRRLRYEH